jgi:hypothetical protein
VFAVRYGSDGPLTVSVERAGEQLTVRTADFTAVIGPDDERGEPELTLRAVST